MYIDPRDAGAIYAEAWNDHPLGQVAADRDFADLSRPMDAGYLGSSLFDERECDLSELPDEAADAVLVAGAILQAYLDDATRLPAA